MWGLLAGLALVTALAVACGGGSSSSTGPSTGGGGSSGAVVQGQIRTQTAAAGGSAVVVVLATMLGIGVAEAAVDGPVPNGTVVKLVPTGGGATLTTTTTGGAFHFAEAREGAHGVRDLHDLVADTLERAAACSGPPAARAVRVPASRRPVPR